MWSTLPVRIDKADLTYLKYDLSDNWKIMYWDFDPYQSQFLVDHGNKTYFRLLNQNRVFYKYKKIFPIVKTV